MFLTPADLDATLYPEISQLIACYSTSIVTMQLATAEAEIELYLAGRYAIRIELAKTGDARHTYLLSLGRDLAVYHLYSLQETIPEHRTKRYEQATAQLKLLMKGEVPLPGVAPLPPPTPEQLGSGQVGWGSKPPRASLV